MATPVLRTPQHSYLRLTRPLRWRT